MYYLATWYAYGGLHPGHPPLLNLEEFCASAGLKFLVFFVVSLGIFFAWERFARGISRLQIIVLQLVALVVFVLVADLLQDNLLAIRGWVYFFGGRLDIFNHLLAGGFYTLQLNFLLLLHHRGAGPQVQTLSVPKAYLLTTKGTVEVPLTTAEIDYLKAAGNYTEVYRAGERFLLGYGIGPASTKLPDDFLRIHRSYLVNLAAVYQIRREGRRHLVVLRDGSELPVGRTYLPVLQSLR